MAGIRRIERPKSLAETALQNLRSSIIHGDIALGQALSERQLAEDLGISKTPVREALAQLRAEGLVHIRPQRGAFVFTLSAREVAELCEFRWALETAALRLSIERAREKFAAALSAVVRDMTAARACGNRRGYLELDTLYHATFFEFCDNSYLRESYSRYGGKIAALRTHLAVRPLHTKLSFQEHGEMLGTIARGDVAATVAILEVHLGRTQQTYSEDIEDIARADRSLLEAG